MKNVQLYSCHLFPRLGRQDINTFHSMTQSKMMPCPTCIAIVVREYRDGKRTGTREREVYAPDNRHNYAGPAVDLIYRELHNS